MEIRKENNHTIYELKKFNIEKMQNLKCDFSSEEGLAEWKKTYKILSNIFCIEERIISLLEESQKSELDLKAIVRVLNGLAVDFVERKELQQVYGSEIFKLQDEK